jgi:hypothetical protein
VGVDILELADKCLALINEAAKHPLSLNYSKDFIGLTDGNGANNFVKFFPKQSFLRVTVYVSTVEEWSQRLEQAAMDFWNTENDDELKIKTKFKDFEENKALIQELLHAAVKE